MSEIIGSGLAFPIQVDRRGGIALARDEQDIDQAIQLILGTAPGERPMRPEFGCAIHDYVFDPADARTSARMSFAVREALRRWEPRIDVLDVRVDRHPVQQDALLLDIRYTVSDANDPRNLVFPFYVIPGEG